MAVTQSIIVRKQLHEATLPITPFPAYVHHRTLTTVESETVPTGAYRVIITPDADIWLSDGTAVVPSSDVVDGTGSFLLGARVPRAFYVVPGQTLSFVSASGAAHVSFEYYLKDVTV